MTTDVTQEPVPIPAPKPTIRDWISYYANQFAHCLICGEPWKGDIHDYLRLPR